jgi:antitoxin component of MazEF toxin-antitoxin module
MSRTAGLRSLPSGAVVSEIPQLLSIKPVRRWGHSHVVTLSKEVRSVLKIQAGDQITFRKVGQVVLLAVVRAFSVAPVSEKEKQQAREALGG